MRKITVYNILIGKWLFSFWMKIEMVNASKSKFFVKEKWVEKDSEWVRDEKRVVGK